MGVRACVRAHLLLLHTYTRNKILKYILALRCTAMLDSVAKKEDTRG